MTQSTIAIVDHPCTTPKCPDCGDTGMVRWLGRNNDEEVGSCATCENRRLRAILQDVVDDMTFCVAPSKGTMAQIHQALGRVGES